MMNIKLADNIRECRKARGLTQEQLAEVLGVTVGAVHKWETRLSMPELRLIVELADFFDTSVDALLGYEMKDNRLDATIARLWQYHSKKDREGLAEVEKALKKYPSTFGVAYAGATLYHGIGLEAKDKALLLRALELFGKARRLLPQNRDTGINEQTLCGSVAGIYFALGEKEKAIALAKAHNAGHLYSAIIGEVLAVEMDKPEEALPYLSHGLMSVFNTVIYITMGYARVYRARRDPENGKAVLQWGIRTLWGMKASDQPDFIDKMCAVMHVCLAGFLLDAGDEGAARASLEQATGHARRFDAAPDYSCRNMRFIYEAHLNDGLYDTLGATAAEAVENAVKEFGSDALAALFREMNDRPEKE